MIRSERWIPGESNVPHGPEQDLLDPGPTFALRGVDLNPAQHGYTQIHNYALYFWRPYLGNTAFSLWELLVSFCYGSADSAYPSISRLARMLTNSDHSRAVVTGRAVRPGPQPLDKAGQPHGLGALQVLRRERLVQVHCRGHGPTTHYTFRILKTLPLLRPDQVQRLSPKLQRDHALWLERYGIDTEQYAQAFDSQAGEALDLTPVVAESTAAAPDLRGEAGRATNHPHEQATYQDWWQEFLSEQHQQLDPDLFQSCLAGAEACALQEGVLSVQTTNE